MAKVRVYELAKELNMDSKELVEKLGRNDLCPCNSGKRFKKCCLKAGRF